MVLKIVSGATQTGADRAPSTVPSSAVSRTAAGVRGGRKAEDGKILPQYQLTETPSASYIQRTEWNVRESDCTVILTVAAELAGGSKRTADFAKKHGKPWLHLSERLHSYHFASRHKPLCDIRSPFFLALWTDRPEWSPKSQCECPYRSSAICEVLDGWRRENDTQLCGLRYRTWQVRFYTKLQRRGVS